MMESMYVSVQLLLVYILFDVLGLCWVLVIEMQVDEVLVDIVKFFDELIMKVLIVIVIGVVIVIFVVWMVGNGIFKLICDLIS